MRLRVRRGSPSTRTEPTLEADLQPHRDGDAVRPRHGRDHDVLDLARGDQGLHAAPQLEAREAVAGPHSEHLAQAPDVARAGRLEVDRGHRGGSRRGRGGGDQ